MTSNVLTPSQGLELQGVPPHPAIIAVRKKSIFQKHFKTHMNDETDKIKVGKMFLAEERHQRGSSVVTACLASVIPC